MNINLLEFLNKGKIYMSLIDLSPIFPYQKNSWETFVDFYKHIETEYLNKNITLWFDGEGSLVSNTESLTEDFYFFSINNILYASSLLSTNGLKVFSGVIEFSDDFLTSEHFKKMNSGYHKKYKRFDASVNIDLKPYDYGEEHKLLFSKYDKVDLLFSHHLVYKGDIINFDAKSSTSLHSTIEWQKKVNEINLKMEQILEAKKNKK